MGRGYGVCGRERPSRYKGADQGSSPPVKAGNNLDEQNELQQKITALEKKQRKQRQQIFQVEDQIAEKRDQLIDGLQKRMSQKTKITPLFTIQWRVV